MEVQRRGSLRNSQRFKPTVQIPARCNRRNFLIATFPVANFNRADEVQEFKGISTLMV